MKRGLVFVIDDIQHFFLHSLVNILVAGLIHGLVRMKARQLYGLLYPQPVKFYPDIFPWKLPIRNISADLIGEEKEPLSAFDLITDRFSLFIFCIQPSRARKAQVEEIMISGGRTEGMGGIALFPAKLV